MITMMAMILKILLDRGHAYNHGNHYNHGLFSRSQTGSKALVHPLRYPFARYDALNMAHSGLGFCACENFCSPRSGAGVMVCHGIVIFSKKVCLIGKFFQLFIALFSA